MKVNNYDGNIVHIGKKRRITGTAKQNMQKKLKDATAAKVRNDLAGQMMEPGDVEPSHLPTLAAMRKQRSRMTTDNTKSTDVMRAVCKMKQRKYIIVTAFRTFG